MAALRLFIKNNIKKSHALFPVRHASYSNKYAKLIEYKKCYKILDISEDSDQEDVRRAYLRLVKKYHPDSGTEEANPEKFAEIDRAFKTLINKKSKERWDVDETETQEQDIQHTAPQHRQYLNYEGIGTGTPFQRQKQYAKIRAIHAAENVLQHRISKVSAEEGALLAKNPLKHKIKTKYGFERLVEDLIQESMSRGDFNNLSGNGKPLPSQNRNPYVDFTTHKLNEVLIDNGFTPEWITLQKEIRADIQELRNSLRVERSYLGPCPLSADENNHWTNTVNMYKEAADNINKKINKFNLVVPIIHKQMVVVDLQKESRKALVEGPYTKGGLQKFTREKAPPVEQASADSNMFDLIDFLFKK